MVVKEENSKINESKSPKLDPIQAAIDYGIDISMLIDNINRSYAERIRRHQIALNTVEKFRKARFL